MNMYICSCSQGAATITDTVRNKIFRMVGLKDSLQKYSEKIVIDLRILKKKKIIVTARSWPDR